MLDDYQIYIHNENTFLHPLSLDVHIPGKISYFHLNSIPLQLLYVYSKNYFIILPLLFYKYYRKNTIQEMINFTLELYLITLLMKVLSQL
ncbi:hypothetical protein CD116_09970 [Staphylococcus schweitzeri]|uniref:Uncharacterized protein n=1 Tax=Staphylococcus schweitzeri TaxID=1654388 RepID=A0A2K4AG02_9STAP|nr:hypothetical protein CD116_09970 [Staphylococcus schweitzeri]